MRGGVARGASRNSSDIQKEGTAKNKLYCNVLIRLGKHIIVSCL
jgi:hypothetical protein